MPTDTCCKTAYTVVMWGRLGQGLLDIGIALGQILFVALVYAGLWLTGLLRRRARRRSHG